MADKLRLPDAFVTHFAERAARRNKTQEYQEPWPEHQLAKAVFERMGTQWNVQIGMSGAIHLGIPYPCVESTFRLLGIPADDWAELFDQVQVIEISARTALNERKK